MDSTLIEVDQILAKAFREKGSFILKQICLNICLNKGAFYSPPAADSQQNFTYFPSIGPTLCPIIMDMACA
jgi:hypothetical protein